MKNVKTVHVSRKRKKIDQNSTTCLEKNLINFTAYLMLHNNDTITAAVVWLSFPSQNGQQLKIRL